MHFREEVKLSTRFGVTEGDTCAHHYYDLRC